MSPGSLLPAREMLADLLLERGQAREALAEYEGCLKLNPGRLNSLYGAGIAAERAGERDVARRRYAELAAMVAKDATAPRSRGPRLPRGRRPACGWPQRPGFRNDRSLSAFGSPSSRRLPRRRLAGGVVALSFLCLPAAPALGQFETASVLGTVRDKRRRGRRRHGHPDQHGHRHQREGITDANGSYEFFTVRIGSYRRHGRKLTLLAGDRRQRRGTGRRPPARGSACWRSARRRETVEVTGDVSLLETDIERARPGHHRAGRPSSCR